MRILTILAFILFAMAAEAQTTPKEDVESLMNEGIGFAVEMLENHGEFFPYARVMGSSGEISVVAYDHGREFPPSQDVIDGLTQAFQAGAASGDYRATALFFDVRAVLAGSSEPTDAVAVALDHREDHSVVVYFPYTIANGQVMFGQISAARGDGAIFPARTR